MRLGFLIAAVALALAVGGFADEVQPAYRQPPEIVTVSLDTVPGLVRVDVPGRPRMAGVLPEEIVQVAPRVGRVMVVAGGAGRLYRAGTPKPLWTGKVDGVWALSPDGTRLAVASDRAVDVVTFADAARTHLLRHIPTRGPVRMLFSRDSRRLLLVDGRLELEIHDLEKRVPPMRERLFQGEAMLESMYLFPDDRTLLFNLQREAGNGSLYCRDLATGTQAMASSYSALEWSAQYRVTWDGRYVWNGSRLEGGGGSAVVSDVERFGVRGEDAAPLLMHAVMTWPAGSWRAGVASVGQAVAYGVGDRLEVYDPVAGRLVRVEGWPVHAGEGGPAPVGFLEPQRLLVVQAGPSIYLLPVAYQRQ